jgi:hypothetical protein
MTAWHMGLEAALVRALPRTANLDTNSAVDLVALDTPLRLPSRELQLGRQS